MAKQKEKEKQSWIFYQSWEKSINLLTMEERGQLLTNLVNWHNNQEIVLNTPMLDIFWNSIEYSLESNLNRYTAQCTNGGKGGRPKKPKQNPIETQTKPKQNPIETQTKPNENPIETQTKPNHNLYDHDNDNDNEYGNEYENGNGHDNDHDHDDGYDNVNELDTISNNTSDTEEPNVNSPLEGEFTNWEEEFNKQFNKL